MTQKCLTVALAATIVLVAVADSWGITRRHDRDDSLSTQFADQVHPYGGLILGAGNSGTRLSASPRGRRHIVADLDWAVRFDDQFRSLEFGRKIAHAGGGGRRRNFPALYPGSIPSRNEPVARRERHHGEFTVGVEPSAAGTARQTIGHLQGPKEDGTPRGARAAREGNLPRDRHSHLPVIASTSAQEYT